jgi:hypothetical protein
MLVDYEDSDSDSEKGEERIEGEEMVVTSTSQLPIAGKKHSREDDKLTTNKKSKPNQGLPPPPSFFMDDASSSSLTSSFHPSSSKPKTLATPTSPSSSSTRSTFSMLPPQLRSQRPNISTEEIPTFGKAKATAPKKKVA